MSRLGFTSTGLLDAIRSPERLAAAGVETIMSHLACPDEPEHELNELQLSRFCALREQALVANADLSFSLANSAGVALGERYHFDILRPGIALYGEGSVAQADQSIQRVVSLSLPILTVRRLSKGDSVGYGATYVAPRDCEVACVAGGYADGISRILSNTGTLYFEGKPAPIVGRVSMDTVIVDVSGLGLSDFDADKLPNIELLGENQCANELAEQAQTIAYEVLTSIGDRFVREYIEQSEQVRASLVK
jgi:alanine racemase